MQEKTAAVETPQALAHALQRSFDDICMTLDLLEPSERELPGMDGGWSPKVELAHVAFWDDFQTGRMVAAREGHSVGGYPQPDHDNDERAQVDARREWDEVLADAQAARRRLIDFAAHLDPALLTQEFPEGERVFSIGHQLRHMVHHTRMHELPIRRFCGSLQRWDRAGLRAFLIEEHARLVEGVLALPPVEIARTPVCGQWTPRDVLAHVLSWNEHADRLLDSWPAPEPATVAKWPEDLSMEVLNERLMAERAGLEMTEILGRLQACHVRLIETFDAAGAAQLASVGKTWRGTEALSLQFYEVAVHEREHAAAIQRLHETL